MIYNNKTKYEWTSADTKKNYGEESNTFSTQTDASALLMPNSAAITVSHFWNRILSLRKQTHQRY